MLSQLELLSMPLQFDFMRQALLIAVLVAVPASLLSCFVVVKGWALLGDAISHAVLPGVVLAYVIGIPIEIGAVIAALVCTVGSGYLANHSSLKPDTIIGVVFSGMFALGIVLYTAIQTNVHLDHILFGDILGVSDSNLQQSALIALFVAVIIALKWQDFLLHAFDPIQARIVGLKTGLLHYGLLIMLSLTVVGGLQAVGIILIISLLIGPGAIAFLITRNFKWMLVIAVTVSIVACVFSIILSFYIDSAPAPTIVVTLSVLFFLLLLKEIKGPLKKKIHVEP